MKKIPSQIVVHDSVYNMTCDQQLMTFLNSHDESCTGRFSDVRQVLEDRVDGAAGHGAGARIRSRSRSESPRRRRRRIRSESGDTVQHQDFSSWTPRQLRKGINRMVDELAKRSYR